jgi:DMSO/TMAO reductase YedYZ molybdopterin-dependent catalytic subunit
LKFWKKSKNNILDNNTIKTILADEKIVISSDTKRDNRIPPGQHETTKWPVLHYGSVQKIDTRDWSFKISGLVEEEKEFKFSDFMGLPQSQVFSDIHCVTSWSQLNNLWEGVAAITLKNVVNILPEAKYILIHAEKNFTTNLALEDFFSPDVIFATSHNGQPLNAKHGGPVRLVVPLLYFWKSAKWVTGVEFLAEDKRGFWESNGYHNHGDPWTEERYSWQEKD